MQFYYTFSDTPSKEDLFFSFWRCCEKQDAGAKKGVNYYPHGPLARVEIGDNKVQGMDYAYTLQGWIKGVNSNTLDKTRDIGQDGLTASINNSFAKDAYGYTLNYHTNDYNAIQGLRWNNATDRFEAVTANSDLIASRNDLFNGNITSMVTTIIKPTITPNNTLEYTPLPQGTAYKYDQLNRLKEMKAWQNLNTVNNTWGTGLAYTGMYENKFSYDANGSILTALAKNQAGQTIDDQTYNHQTIGGKKFSNRTYSINDAATQTSGNDLLNQIAFNNTAATINTVNNYSYTEIGERKSDKSNDISLITWTVYGKIKSVTRSTGSTKNNLKFDYDATGNRIAKHIYTSANVFVRSEYYTRDAQGNIMSTYEYKPVGSSINFAQTEKEIYGSSEVGIEKTRTELIGALPLANPFTRTLGNKEYTGSNHLGNVLVTFTDRKLPIDADNNGTIDEFWPEVIAANDYAPFGGLLTERTFNKNTFPNSFNGKRDDNELDDLQDYGMRMYSKWGREPITIDPLAEKYPMLTPYQFASNRPIDGTDMDGKEWNQETKVKSTATAVTITTVYTVNISVINTIGLSDKQKEAKLSDLKLLTEMVFHNVVTGKLKDGKSYTWESSLQINFVDASKTNKNDFQLELVDYIPNPEIGKPGIVWGLTEKLGGETQKNKIQLVVKDKIEMEGFLGKGGTTIINTIGNQVKSFAEELGHTTGLGHTGTKGIAGFLPDETDPTILKTAGKNNVMIQGGDAGTSSKFVFPQYNKMRNEIKKDTEKK